SPAGARAVLDVVELAHDIAGRAPGDRGQVSQTFQIGTMADRALQGLACATRADQSFTSRDAADRHVGDEVRSRVAVFELLEIFGHLDDALTDRLLLAGIGSGEKPSGYDRLRHANDLDHPNIGFWFQRRKISCGRLHL